MEYPDLHEEKKLWKRGIASVVGLDEAGRGPLAGPVVAGAVMVKPGADVNGLGINDSKKLSEKKREELYEKLTSDKNIIWAAGIVDEQTIDRINILEASKLAMQQAVEALGVPVEHLLIDGNFLLPMDISQASIIKGDSKVFSIAAASIIAKVTRDRLMQKLHAQYPAYGFDGHKGYGTVAHIKNLKELGPCPAHRKSFYPVSALI